MSSNRDVRLSLSGWGPGCTPVQCNMLTLDDLDSLQDMRIPLHIPPFINPNRPVPVPVPFLPCFSCSFLVYLTQYILFVSFEMEHDIPLQIPHILIPTAKFWNGFRWLKILHGFYGDKKERACLINDTRSGKISKNVLQGSRCSFNKDSLSGRRTKASLLWFFFFVLMILDFR